MNKMSPGLLLGVFLLFVIALVLIALPVPQLLTEQQTVDSSIAAQPVELRFGHNIPVDSAMHQAALRFAEEVEYKSSGQVRITVYPEQQLGNDHQMVEMARAGELDILLTPTAKMSVAVPAMQYADLPFLFPSREAAYQLLDGEPGAMLLRKLSSIGLIGVTFWENGFKHFTGNQPLLKPEDFDGLNIRVMKSRILMEQFKAFGAHPVPIDFHATRKALADGVVDGQENPLIAIVSMGFHEVQSDLTLSGHGYLSYVLSFSEQVFNTLTTDIQKILTDTARELTVWERTETLKREEKLLQIIQQAGVQIHTVDKEAQHQFVSKTAYIADRYEGLIGADIMSKTQELLYKEYMLTDSGNMPIVIGLDTDLSQDAKVSGLAIKRGALLAINEINMRGGVLGKPLRLIARDHQGLPSLGVNNIESFAADANVVAVIGGQHGAVVNTELQTIHTMEIPFLAPWSAVSGIVENDHKPNFVYRLSANDRLAGPFIIEQVISKYKRPAILYENSIWGRGNYHYMQQYLQGKGMKFVSAEAVNRGSAVNLRPIMEQISTAGADVVVMVLKPEEGGSLIEAMAQLQKPLPVVSHWGIVGGNTWNQHKHAIKQLDLTIFQTFSFIDNNTRQARLLAERYKDYFGLSSVRQIKAPAATAHAYDLVQLLAMAIQQAGTTERGAVRNALENLSGYEGVVKHYQPPFTPERHDALDKNDYRMTRFAADGAMIPIP